MTFECALCKGKRETVISLEIKDTQLKFKTVKWLGIIKKYEYVRHVVTGKPPERHFVMPDIFLSSQS